jgi:L-asparagine transporter-like permease
VIVIQAMVQFLAQCVAVVLLRRRAVKADAPSFRMPLYPLPVVVAFLGWLFILISSDVDNILFALTITFGGLAIFLYRSRRERTWPFETL